MSDKLNETIVIDFGDSEAIYGAIKIKKSDVKQVGLLLKKYKKEDEEYNLGDFFIYLKKNNIEFENVTADKNWGF